MSTKSSAAPIMAWNWVIQSLAGFNRVDSSTLVDLVEKAPENLGKDAREMISLRFLEIFFIHGNEAAVHTDSTQNTQISFDPSEQCEDVLHKILETSESVKELNRTKWNVRPFIMHKRSSLAKSPIQKFKEALLEGRHPLLASLKERSKLGVGNTSENTSPDADVYFDAQTTVVKDDLSSPNPANKSNKIQESLLQESNDEENSARGITEHIRREEPQMSIVPPVKGLDKMDHDDNVPKGQVKRVSTDILQNLESGEDGDPKNTLPNVSNSRPSGEGNGSMENCVQLETSTDIEISDDECTDVSAKKEAFLSSQCTLSQDFMATNDYSETCLCVKCNEGGQLLVCSSDACPFRVHGNCLRSASTLDENGAFFCPFCAYSRAIAKYQEVKRKASLARIDLQTFLSPRVKYTRKRACVRNEKNPVAEPSGLGVDNELHCGDKAVSVGDQKLAERQYNEKESHVSAASRHSRRSMRHKPQYTSPSIPLIGRKKLPWTKAEEEILKKGVQRFPSVNNNGIPWKEILDFGQDVFQKGRTNIDLKDKWRNILKGSHAAKKPKL